MLNIILTGIVAFFTIFIPGELFALALLKNKTKFNLFEISVFGFILGLIAPTTLTWIEGYFSSYIHIFSFSLALFEVNAIILSIIGFILCVQQGVFSFDSISKISRKKYVKEELHQISVEQKEYQKGIGSIRDQLSKFDSAKTIINSHISQEENLQKRQNDEINRTKNNLSNEEIQAISNAHKKELERLIKDHEQEEQILLNKLTRNPEFKSDKKFELNINKNWIWIVLLLIMLIGFATRLLSISVAPKFFIFDPYFDMLAAKSILAFGHQFYLSPSAWPVVQQGTVMRIQPLIPYLEAYWYSLAGFFGAYTLTFNQALMSYVGSVYPPIAGALLIFVVFILIYHEYDKYVAIIAASLTALVPILFNTFIAGQQLLQPWGIFSLFFFFATYLLAIKHMDNPRYAILAGIAFASTFLGAHYYTVDTGVLALYIIIQGIISILRGDIHKNFYKMNAIVLIIITMFLAIYEPYHATLSGKIPKIFGIPITLSFPLFALIFIALLDYIPKILHKKQIIFKTLNKKQYLKWLIIVLIIISLLMILTPIGKPIQAYLELSKKFTTPSSALFMTVQEFAPTGLGYNFFLGGFGLLGTNIFGYPILVWSIILISITLILISIIYRNSKTGVLYLAIAIPLIVAAVSEVKYLPHFAVAYIILFGILIGEVINLARHGITTKNTKENTERKSIIMLMFSIGLFFISPIISMIYLLVLIFTHKVTKPSHAWAIFILFIIIEFATLFVNHTMMVGEIRTVLASFSASAVYSSNPASACNTFNSHGNSIGRALYCNTIPQYWIDATSWMSKTIGPYAPRVLAWWDYGDWINWFGNTNAVLRGDNSVAKEDYAVAASYVLGTKFGYTPSTLANVMNGNQSKYIVFDEQLIPKWGALDFLACIHTNATSEAFAIAQAKLQNQSSPYILGTSNCEITHDPQYALVPLSTLISNGSSGTLSDYCSLNTKTPYIRTLLVNGFSLSNRTLCLNPSPNRNGIMDLYNNNGTKSNAVIQQFYSEGLVNIRGIRYVEFLAIYLPSSNGTITNSPSEFYQSNYYKGFFLGNLEGFTQVYPSNIPIGVNFVNYTYPIRIYSLDNYIGGNAPLTPKPSYIKNNYTIP